MRKRIEVKRGNVTVPIYRTKQVKNGKIYVNHTIIDCSSGKRRLRYAASLEKAKAKALEIAVAIDQGKPEVLRWEDGHGALMTTAQLACECVCQGPAEVCLELEPVGVREQVLGSV